MCSVRKPDLWSGDREFRRNRRETQVAWASSASEIGYRKSDSVRCRPGKLRCGTQAGESLPVHPSFPPASVSQSRIGNLDVVLLSATRDQHDMAVRSDFGNRPELLDLVGIGFTCGRWMDVFCTWSRLRTILTDDENDRLTDPIRVLHVCLPSVKPTNRGLGEFRVGERFWQVRCYCLMTQSSEISEFKAISVASENRCRGFLARSSG